MRFAAITGTLLASAALALPQAAAAQEPAAPAPAPARAPAPAQRADAAARPLLETTSYKLANGLTVIFHIDRSDPVVSVALAANVGSSRETPGRTGFAHMFEHLFFLDSENLGRGGLDKLSARVGGQGANGFTSRDITVYNQEVPKDALEKMIWAEADKLGYFIKTVTPAVLQKEKQVVKNEKRQRVDNAPYGHIDEILTEQLYPKDHPYNWQVIGSLADLDAAQLSDVQQFYRRWYVPNNAMLVITGDFDPAQARAWIDRYFGEIARGAEPPARPLRPSPLATSTSLMYEDSYARLPQLRMMWPGAATREYRDLAALEILAGVLTANRDAVLTKLLVEERQLTDQVFVRHGDSTLAGEFQIGVRAFDGVDLTRVSQAIEEGLRRFDAAGVDPATLQQAKASVELASLRQVDNVGDKAAAIAVLTGATGDPGAYDKLLAAYRAVTADDVMRVFRRYIYNRPHAAVSAVPKGKPELAVQGAKPATVVTEPIVQGAEAAIDAGPRAVFTPTPSRIDRSKEPPAGPTPSVRVPAVWQAKAANGLALSGIEDPELPLVGFALSLDGGQRFDDPAKPGAANLLARVLTRGTARRTPAELEKALGVLGATVTVTANAERIVLRGQTLSRNFDATMALVREILTEPRWDPAELALAKAAVTAQISDSRTDPGYLARRVTDVVSYAKDDIRTKPILGTPASVAALTMEDLKALAARAFAPALGRFRVTGAVTRAQVAAAMAPLAAAWPDRPASVPAAVPAPAPTAARLYFYDVPDAKQSRLYFTGAGPSRADADFYPAQVANYILGGGGFASRLTQELREGKGYTYGIGSAFEGGLVDGRFGVSSPVRANVTLESAELTRRIIADYARTYTDADLAVAKGFLTKSRAFAFESPDAKLAMLAAIGDYGLPLDYPARDAKTVDAMTVERIRALAGRYMAADRLTYVIVGDAKTQRDRLSALNLGPAVDAKPLID